MIFLFVSIGCCVFFYLLGRHDERLNLLEESAFNKLDKIIEDLK